MNYITHYLNSKNKEDTLLVEQLKLDLFLQNLDVDVDIDTLTHTLMTHKDIVTIEDLRLRYLEVHNDKVCH